MKKEIRRFIEAQPRKDAVLRRTLPHTKAAAWKLRQKILDPRG